MKLYVISILFFTLNLFSLPHALAESPEPVSDNSYTIAEATEDMEDGGFDDFEEEEIVVYDPIEPFNRAMFVFNDKLYFWVFRPVAWGYGYLVPEKARIGVSRFFSNITTPIRFTNSLLQFKFKPAGIELSRFVINTTIGVAGFMDPAKEKWKLNKHREDFGQTMGFFGAGPVLYINWPLFGPSNVRDTIGMAGDSFLDPTNYLFPHNQWAKVGVKSYNKINETSLKIGFYEDLKKDAFDPYTFFRDAYNQHRESLIKE